MGGCCTPPGWKRRRLGTKPRVDGNSHPRRAGYSWGNFSVMPGPPTGGGARAFARPGFPPPAPLAFKGAVSPAFGLTLYGGVLTRLSRALGTPPDILSGVCRPPSRTAHPPLSPPGCYPGLGVREGVGGVSLAHPRGPETALHRSHLHYAPPLPHPQRRAAVKLHRVFSPPRRGGSQDSAPGGGFAGPPRAGTVGGTSLIHSCTPELTRQGIWLP